LIQLLRMEKTEFTFEEGYDLDSYKDFAVQGKLIHCLLIRCEIDNNSFAFATLVLNVE
jgi:hypothetical protein